MSVRSATQAFGAPATGVLVLADGTIFAGQGAGAKGEAVGEVCFNTGMTGYQETLTDPSYSNQIIAFTSPHIGNVGTNRQDIEASSPAAAVAARGAVLRAPITPAANWRSELDFNAWLERRGIVAITGVDTRRLTRSIRETGMPHGVIAHSAEGAFDLPSLQARARDWAGIEGTELAGVVTTAEPYPVSESAWRWPDGVAETTGAGFTVAVIDFGVKRSILRRLGSIGAEAWVVPAGMSADEILNKKPDGVLLANGPGDPAATAKYAASVIGTLVESGIPVMGVCLGHQMLALALGAQTEKMAQGHHGANHPVKDLKTGKVEIVSMNHGFTVNRDSLPETVEETHVSLFDGTNCGIAHKSRPVFSVQHHPEAGPGPHDAFSTFDRFAALMRMRETA